MAKKKLTEENSPIVFDSDNTFCTLSNTHICKNKYTCCRFCTKKCEYQCLDEITECQYITHIQPDNEFDFAKIFRIKTKNKQQEGETGNGEN